MNIKLINRGDNNYPNLLRERLKASAPSEISMIGDAGILRHVKLGLICSIKCPGSIIIKTFDAIRELRDEGVVVAGGFHSPMERECLDFLLRGIQPVILCPARGLANLRPGKEAAKALEEGRLLVLTPFGENERRTTRSNAIFRNELVAAISDAVFVPYASASGNTWVIAQKIMAREQRLYTLEDENNDALVALGASILEKQASSR